MDRLSQPQASRCHEQAGHEGSANPADDEDADAVRSQADVLRRLQGGGGPQLGGCMGNPVVHWEMMSKEPEKVADFYAKIFGWKVQYRPELNYRLVETGNKMGING